MAQTCHPCFRLLVLSLTLAALAKPAAPAIFIFGDSIVDVGTNNYLPVHQARADFPFNGIDYHGSRPTGRFSNGYNIADTVARSFGYERSPSPFLSLLYDKNSVFQRDILWGANFASGGAGLLDTTGKQFGKVVPMGEQVQQFAAACSNISQVMGPEAEALIANSILFIVMGSNDIFDYYMYNESRNQPEFISNLMSSYQVHLSNLFNLGARKFGILSVSPIGCIPRFRVYNETGGCLEEINSYARQFYEEIQGVLEKLSSEHKEMKYSLGNSYDMTMDVIDNPLAFRFKDTKTACCGAGILGAQSPCLPNATICQNRDDYFFWDRYHPSQLGSELAALTLYGGAQRYVSPINFEELAENIISIAPSPSY